MHGGGGDGGGDAGEGGHGVCESGGGKDGYEDCGGEGWGDCGWNHARVGLGAEAELRELIGCGNRVERGDEIQKPSSERLLMDDYMH